jgi:TolB protein
MSTRRLLWAMVGVLSIVILVAGAGVAALAYLRLSRATPEQLLVLGSDKRLLLLDASGGQRVLAEGTGGGFRYPTIAPDGRRIAYISEDANGLALYSLNLATDTRTELYRSSENPPLYATWSPDGDHISFLSNLSGGGLGVNIVLADGSRQSDLIGTTPGSSYFAWRPDGDMLLLHMGGSSFQNGTVATYRPDNNQPVQQLADPGLFQAPAWSSDGTQFFYVAQPPISGAPSIEAVESVLTRVSASGGAPTTLASEKMVEMRFTRAPTSDDIAYITVGPDGFGALKLVGAAGGAARTLSREGEHIPAFFWSPDGAQIAYLTFVPQQSGLPRLTWHVVARAGGTVRDLAEFVPSQDFVALLSYFDAYSFAFDLWSPQGDRLVYGADDGVYVLDLGSGKAERRADGVLGMWVGRR